MWCQGLPSRSRPVVILSQPQAYPPKRIIIPPPLIMSEIEKCSRITVIVRNCIVFNMITIRHLYQLALCITSIRAIYLMMDL